MPIDYKRIMSLPPRETRQAYTIRDTILYALGVGAAIDKPTDPVALRLCYEESLQALPTMATVLGSPGFWLKEPLYGVDWKRILHGEQSIQMHKPLAVEGDLISVLTIDEIFDKGAGKGAILYSTRKIHDAKGGDLIASVSQSSFLRGDGGYGGRAEGAPKPHPLPSDRPADIVIDLPTRPEQALLYRLMGDYNPLHADPEIARQGGFDRPILHGLCTYGVAGRAILQGLCGNEAAKLKRFDARFSSPVFPGETLRVELWREGVGRAALRASALERSIVVLQNGRIEFDN